MKNGRFHISKAVEFKILNKYSRFLFCLILFFASIMSALQTNVIVDSDTYRLSQNIDAIKYVESFYDIFVLSTGKFFYFYILYHFSNVVGSSIVAVQLLQGFVLFLTGAYLFKFLIDSGIRILLSICAVVAILFVFHIYNSFIFTTTMQSLGTVLMIAAFDAYIRKRYSVVFVLCLLAFLAHPYFIFVLPFVYLATRSFNLNSLCLCALVLPVVFAYSNVDISTLFSEYIVAFSVLEGSANDYFVGFRYDFYLTIFVGVLCAFYISKFDIVGSITGEHNCQMCRVQYNQSRHYYQNIIPYVYAYVSIFLVYPFVMNFPYHDRFLQTGWVFESFVFILIFLKILVYFTRACMFGGLK